MADPDRDTTTYPRERRSVLMREGNGTGWFIGIIVALALLAIGYMVFASSWNTPAPAPEVTPTIETPVVAPEVTPAPVVTPELAPATPNVTPATPTPAVP